MDKTDLIRAAAAVLKCKAYAKCKSFMAASQAARNLDNIKELLLAILEADNDAGVPDPDWERWLNTSFIEMMESRELRRLCGVLTETPAFPPRRP